MRTTLRISTCAIGLLLIAGCKSIYIGMVGLTPEHEIVISKGDVIKAETPNGTVRISALSETKRRFEWNDCAWEMKLYPRVERFLGKYGIYNPGDTRLEECKGIFRISADESQLDFPSQTEAIESLKRRYVQTVWNREGLLVGVRAVYSRHQLSVDVVQITINGRMPSNFPEARDNAISFARSGEH
jgi:hypothetical protein